MLYWSWVITVAFDYNVIGKRIRKARESKGWTQEVLAESMDVSNAYISKIERGRTSVNLDTLSRICEILEQSSEYILTGANSASTDYLRNEIIDMLQGCSPAKIKLISQVIKPIIDYNE